MCECRVPMMYFYGDFGVRLSSAAAFLVASAPTSCDSCCAAVAEDFDQGGCRI